MPTSVLIGTLVVDYSVVLVGPGPNVRVVRRFYPAQGGSKHYEGARLVGMTSRISPWERLGLLDESEMMCPRRISLYARLAPQARSVGAYILHFTACRKNNLSAMHRVCLRVILVYESVDLKEMGCKICKYRLR